MSPHANEVMNVAMKIVNQIKKHALSCALCERLDDDHLQLLLQGSKVTFKETCA